MTPLTNSEDAGLGLENKFGGSHLEITEIRMPKGSTRMQASTGAKDANHKHTELVHQIF